MIMNAGKSVLFFTNSDYGQANVVLATAHSLAVAAPDVQIHIASFQPLRDAVQAASDFATASMSRSSAVKSFIFHQIEGTSWGPASFRPEIGIAPANDLTPGLLNSAKCVSLIPSVMLPWRPAEFTAIYHESERVLEEVKPDLIVLEPLFTPGLTLCHHMKLKWMVLAPNTLKDFALPLQPGLAMLWKYPLTCSAMPFPLPWSLIPRNIFLNLVAAYAVLTDPGMKKTTQLLREEVDDPSISLMTAMEMGVLKAPPPGLRILVAISPDIDYPFAVLPPHVTPCGPIVRAVAPIRSVDPALYDWLGHGRTVYVNLGTHLKADPAEAREMALAFKSVLDQAGAFERDGAKPLQILWKIGRKPGADGAKPARDVYEGQWQIVVDVLQHELAVDRVRITDWVNAEPKSVLESGHVICSINHGGANSFYEALCTGVPQALLPAWSDCYDFANRVELLGIGKWANQMAKPRWKQEELSSVLEEILFGPEAESILQRAKDLAARHPEEAGREKAAAEVLGFLNC
ncbi:UDP-Glycosyltransferase/glycogen phosphorylase [Thozetella sp. PMI_491]|nr:UDP-Glycosyltransferase/glycogen phosphorylase [Thozetella sp. PMI_491]